MANNLLNARGLAAMVAALAPSLDKEAQMVSVTAAPVLIDAAGVAALLTALKPYLQQRYPLDALGYDDDGSLSAAMIASLAKFQGKPITTYYAMFNNNTSVRVIPNLDFSQTTTLSHFANAASNVQYVPYIDAPLCTTVYAAFRKNESLKYHPGLNAPLATEIDMFINGCSALEYVGEIILPGASGYREFMSGNTNIRMIGKLQLNTRPSTSCEAMFYNCRKFRTFVYEDFAPTNCTTMFFGCNELQEARFNLRYATTTSNLFGNGTAANDCPDCAAWLNWGDDSGAGMSPSSLAKRYEAGQTSLDFRGLTNWGTLHPASLLYTLKNLPMRAYTQTSSSGAMTGVLDTPCKIYFSAATKAALTDEMKSIISSKNYTIA